MWVRGLKLLASINASAILESHPMWVRGLKPVVEIYPLMAMLGRTLCGCVD